MKKNMKCLMCDKGQLREKEVEYSESGMSIGRFKAKVCTSCNGQFFNSSTAKKIQKRSKELKLFGLAE